MSGTSGALFYAWFQLPEIKFPAAEINNVFLKKGLPHHVSRSFTFVQDDDWRFPHYDALPSAVILNGCKNAVREKRETATWHRVKNLWFWWHLTAFLTTGIDPSHSFRMTFNVSLTTTANPLLLFRMTPNGNHMLRLLTHSQRLTAHS